MLTVIIPTYNAAQPLMRLLAQLGDTRVIVADGGSTDDTLRVALPRARLALGASGRGAQLRLGAQLAILSGKAEDWFLFLHADSVLPDDWSAVVERAMQRPNPRYFRFRADATGLKPRIMERLIAFRNLGWGLPYGDQGLLISRAQYEAVGGYAPIPLFEDVDMADRLPNLAPLPAYLRTDVAAYERDGYRARARRNLGLLRNYRAGVSPHALAKGYR